MGALAGDWVADLVFAQEYEVRCFVLSILGFFAVLVWAAFPGCSLFRFEGELNEGALLALRFSEVVRGYCLQSSETSRELLRADLLRELNRHSYPHKVEMRFMCHGAER